jgi:hypothetical protein
MFGETSGLYEDSLDTIIMMDRWWIQDEIVYHARELQDVCSAVRNRPEGRPRYQTEPNVLGCVAAYDVCRGEVQL